MTGLQGKSKVKLVQYKTQGKAEILNCLLHTWLFT